MYILNGKFMVVGLGLSGVASCKVLLKRGGNVRIYDTSTAEYILRNKEQLVALGAESVETDDIESCIEWSDVVVLSPGVAIDNFIPLTAKRFKKRIIGELELGIMLTAKPFVAVTGTNGKTTTCSLVSHVLDSAKISNVLCGNVGSPVCDNLEIIENGALPIVEVSSFQLETVHSFCPHIGVLLNVTSDHLERHYNMENYTYLKSRLFANMRLSEYAVLNFDDELVMKVQKGLKCKCVYFSLMQKVDGAYVQNGDIYYYGEKIMPQSDIPLDGEHNLQNVLATVCVLKLLGVDNESIVCGIKSFAGVKHRIEFVKKIDGISFYNDSKATNIDATLKAIATMQAPTVVIVGGKDKGFDYAEFFKGLNGDTVRHIVAFGENRFSILQSAKDCNYQNISLTNSLESAVKLAYIVCEKNGAVLFSPTTSSFDMFSGFEQRGQAFTALVNSFE